jgi:threonyl-tRNA synthetase
MERFVAVLLEHCAGDFPLWLTTDQVAILPISDKYNEYCENLLQLLNNSDIRGFVDDRNEKIGKKIRESEMNKIPFMLIIGEKEAENNLLAVRQRSVGDLGTMTTNDFADLLNKTIKSELALND